MPELCIYMFNIQECNVILSCVFSLRLSNLIARYLCILIYSPTHPWQIARQFKNKFMWQVIFVTSDQHWVPWNPPFWREIHKNAQVVPRLAGRWQLATVVPWQIFVRESPFLIFKYFTRINSNSIAQVWKMTKQVFVFPSVIWIVYYNSIQCEHKRTVDCVSIWGTSERLTVEIL